MKRITFLLFWFSCTAVADLAIFTEPLSPAVYFSDLNQNLDSDAELKAKGPWFQAEHTVRNDFAEPVEVRNLTITARTNEGKTRSQTIKVGSTLTPGESKNLRPYFLSELPIESDQALTVTVTAEFKRSESIEKRSITFKTH